MFDSIKQPLAIIRSFYKEPYYEIEITRPTQFTPSYEATITIRKSRGTTMSGMAALIRRSRCERALLGVHRNAVELDSTGAYGGKISFRVLLKTPFFKTWVDIHNFLRSAQLGSEKYGLTSGPNYSDPEHAGIIITLTWVSSATQEDSICNEQLIRAALDANGISYKIENVFIPMRPPLVRHPVRKTRLILPLMANGINPVIKEEDVEECL